MRIYVDDDLASPLLARLLRNDGHDVELPVNVDMSGKDDSVHFAYAIREKRAILSRNYTDFQNLHDLIVAAQGHHSGVLVVRQDNDPRRDLSPRGIARAIRNLLAAGVPIADRYIILNHWR